MKRKVGFLCCPTARQREKLEDPRWLLITASLPALPSSRSGLTMGSGKILGIRCSLFRSSEMRERPEEGQIREISRNSRVGPSIDVRRTNFFFFLLFLFLSRSGLAMTKEGAV